MTLNDITNNIYVCKFGGTSLATAESVRLVQDIIKRDVRRQIIVVSAPGKTDSCDKVTEMLIELYNNNKCGKFDSRLLDKISERYIDIADAFDIDFGREIEQVWGDIRINFYYDYIVSRGEYLMARLLSKILGYSFVDSVDLIGFSDNEIDMGYTTQKINKISIPCVVPGFYGLDGDRIKCLPRGGSDLTGAIITACGRYGVYENWTDVDGVYDRDPKVYSDARVLNYLSYRELDKILERGAQVLQRDCIKVLEGKGIVSHIKNTFRADSEGTCIVD